MGTERKAAIDAMLTTQPPPSMVLAPSWSRQPDVRRIGPTRFKVRAVANVSGSHSSRPPGKLAPALFTSTSSVSSEPARASIELESVISSRWYENGVRSAS